MPDQRKNSLSPLAELTARTSDHSESNDEESKDTSDYSKLDTFLQLRMRSRNELRVTRLPNGDYLAECNTCNAGMVFQYYEDAIIALHDHRCFLRSQTEW
ncbi:MAG: hypothetical protein PXY39_11495 [archaeon]|nr:hypothetical protein [archaeon]